jgi:hypothetical protein
MIKNLKQMLSVGCILTVGVLGFPLRGRASVIQNIDIPVSGFVVNPCNGENVAFNGIDHSTLSLTFNSRGGSHFSIHDNIHVTAIGDQGNTYEGNQEDKIEANFQVGEEVIEPSTFSEISKGSAPNFEIHALFHLTMNPNGTVTAFVNHFTAACRG